MLGTDTDLALVLSVYKLCDLHVNITHVHC